MTKRSEVASLRDDQRANEQLKEGKGIRDDGKANKKGGTGRGQAGGEEGGGKGERRKAGEIMEKEVGRSKTPRGRGRLKKVTSKRSGGEAREEGGEGG